MFTMGPTPKNKYGFKYSQLQSDALTHELNHLALLSLEIHGCVVDVVDNEKALLGRLVEKIREFDPDIFLGYEIHSASWGYLIERAKLEYQMDLAASIARVTHGAKTKVSEEDNEYGYKHDTALSASGRIFLNVWRLMRTELTLTSYTLENTVFHALHERIPKFSAQKLTEWYDRGAVLRWRTLKYYLQRVQFNLRLLDDTSKLSRTCEFARVYGIEFYSVLSRGSQFKVESILARITKPENFIMITPTFDQVGRAPLLNCKCELIVSVQVRGMRAIDCLPLNMEPESRFYNNPMAVLDFQSLYPSVMIAYNYCYSTCLGRIASIGTLQEFGCMGELDIPMEQIELLKDHLFSMDGVLGRMLSEILDTRVMVKQSMKLYKNNKALLRILDARQLSLKLIANVTYGYAGASFSGRMPCSDIADAIVQTGRATLENAIKLVNDRKQPGVTVLYGDTDSMFVNLPGMSKDEAFKVGHELVHD
ncbi:DNA polymerase zeta, partial [Cladochytrium tenue]